MEKREQKVNALNIEQKFTESVLERPVTFTLNGKYYYVFQPSLGISIMSSEMFRKISINKELLTFNYEYEMLRICSEYKETALRLIAIHTFKRRSDAIDEYKVAERVNELSVLDEAEMSTLIKVIMEWETYTKDLVKYFGLDKERTERERIAKLKDEDSSSITYGGRSIYGAILDNAAERYGWELGYILWGISQINLNMMLQDSVQSVYLTDEERKSLHIRPKGNILKADDPNNIEAVKAFLRGV